MALIQAIFSQQVDVGFTFRKDLTRADLEKMVDDLVNETILPCEKALKDAGMSVSDIDDVLLVGGMTRMPLVKRKVEEFFKQNMECNAFC